MILRVIKVRFWIALIFVSANGYCQLIQSFSEEYPFLQHLATQKLYEERLFVLHSLTDSAVNHHRINLEKGWTLHALGNLEYSLKYYHKTTLDKIVQFDFQDNYLDLLFRTNHYATLDSTLQSTLLPASLEKNKVSVSLAMIHTHYTPATLPDSIPENIQLSYARYFQADKKSAFLGGFYSALIPGMGKVYAGKKRQAWGLFMANVIFGLQTYEAYRKTGLSPRFYIFGSIFSITYLSNIYGSAVSVRKSKRDQKNQLHYELSHYYLQSADVYNSSH